VVPILSQISAVDTFPKTYFNIILPSTFRFHGDFFLSVFPTKMFHAFLITPMRATCSACLILQCGAVILPKTKTASSCLEPDVALEQTVLKLATGGL
jgi:hypothetical protein